MCGLSDGGVSLSVPQRHSYIGWTGDSASQNSADSGSVALEALLFPGRIGR